MELFAHLFRGEKSATRFALWFLGNGVAMAAMPLLSMTALQVAHHASGTAASGNAETVAITLPASWAFYLFSAWLVLAGVFLARIAAGFGQIWALRRRSAVLPLEVLAPELQQTIRQFAGGREVEILVSDEIQSPTAIGLLSPAILLPAWLKDELSTAELRQVLLHELSHLRRWDDWSNLLQKIVKALFFFHPAVWWMEKRISLEREMACDEAVLEHTHNPRSYAETLLHLAEKSLLRRSLILAQAAVSGIGQMSRRITRILGDRASRPTAAWKVIGPTFAGLVVVSLISLEGMPQLIGFAPNQTLAVDARMAPASPNIARTAFLGRERLSSKRFGEAAFRAYWHRRSR